MALEKKVDTEITVKPDGQLLVQQSITIFEDGVLIAGPSVHRTNVPPGQKMDNQPPEVVQIAAIIHTPEVVAAWRAEQVRLAGSIQQD